MLRNLFIALSFSAFLLIPTAALAVDWLPIVPCGGHTSGGAEQPPCTPCYMFKSVENVTDFIFQGLTGPLAAFMFVVAGGMFLVGAGNVKLQQQARTLFTNTILGVIIIFIAWIGTNFLIKNIAPNSAPAGAWFHFECPDFLQEIGKNQVTGEVPAIVAPRVVVPDKKPADYTATDLTSSFMQGKAVANKEAYPRQNSPALQTLIGCIYQDPVIKAMAMPAPNLTSSAKQTTGTYTYDNDNEICNYTRGVPYGGGKCSHSEQSCHYGGTAGSQGAEAVDMNARGAKVAVPGTDDGTGKPKIALATEEELFCQLYRLLVVQKKCGFRLLNWEGDHTHISTNTCDADKAGVSSQRGSAIPDCRSFQTTP